MRDRRVSGFKLPPLNSAADAAEAMSAVLQAMASGALTPSEGESLSQTITAFLKVFEVVDIEARLTALARVHQLNSIFAIFRVSDHDKALVLKSRCL